MTYEKESQVIVSKGSPRENELDSVIEELKLRNVMIKVMVYLSFGKIVYLEEKFTEEPLARCPDSKPENGCVNGGEEGAIQPTTTL